MFIVINTPNGNVGRVVADKLIGAGEYVALLTRHRDKVTDFARLGPPSSLGSGRSTQPSCFWLAM